MNIKYLVGSISLLLIFSTPGVAQPNIISLHSLLNEMINRDALARYPDPYYATRQYSSYDRDALSSDTSNWFANWDRTQFIRTENRNGHKEYVMMDTDGPGAIVRFWMTFAGKSAGQGILRIYFDREENPTIKGNAMDILSGGSLVGMPLSMSVSPKTDYKMRGHNLYLPLPYEEHCKITYESDHIQDAGAKKGGESVYYNINYRDYAQNTSVRTFTLNQLQKNRSLLRKVQDQLMFRNKKWDLQKEATNSIPLDVKIESGKTRHFKISGPSAIRSIGLQLHAENNPQALRSTIIQIEFDGNRTIWCPIGDFFGTGYQYRKSNTWYTSVTNDNKMSAYWVMPFKSKANVSFINLGNQAVSIEGTIYYTDWKWDDLSMYFGTSWHQYSNMKTWRNTKSGNQSKHFDINYTTLDGSGVYVGDVLTLFNTSYAWWGEGDEKVYIDNEKFPSNFGTGTEDYYGYAWARPESFINHPFISQPDGDGNITPGYTVDMRFRSLDALPFREKLKFDMEMWHWVDTNMDYAPTSFYYLKPGGKSFIKPDRRDARKRVTLKRSDLISPVITDHRIEGENLIIESSSGGRITFQHLDKPNLSQEKQLWWWNGQIGDVLKTKFISDKAGIFNGLANFVQARDYGKVSISINGKLVLNNFDEYHKSLTMKKVKLGQVKLRKGENNLTVQITGNSKELDKAFFGLDYIDFIDN